MRRAQKASDSGGLYRQIPGAGPLDAECLLLGEAGGDEEGKQGRPFVGPTGRLLEEILASVGWHRRSFRIDNVIQRHPPWNRLHLIPKDEKERWLVDCRERVESLPSVRLVIALGGLALEVFGKRGITNWRGSLLEWTATDGRTITVLPMHHPVYTFTDPITRVTIDRDFQRARDWLAGRIEPPKRKYIVRPSIEEVELFASLVVELGDDDALTTDIETPGGFWQCAGFAYKDDEAICVPTTRAYWKETDLLQRAWRAIRAMCRSRVPKVLMHGLYDAYWYRRQANIEINNWQWDLMCLHHCLAPQEPHDLAYIASMIQDYYVFWKREAKDVESLQRYAKTIDATYTYNCMDCCEQIGLFRPLLQRVKERGMLEFYEWHYRRLLPHMLDLMCHGMRVDQPTRNRRAAHARIECIKIEDRLATIAGEKVFAKKSLKRSVLIRLLYDKLKLPKKYNFKQHVDGKDSDPTTDIFTLQRLTHKYPKKMGEIGPLIITHRKQERLAAFLDPKKVDHDARFRSSYGFDPSTGRFSSGPNPMGTGDNAQNQDRRVRDTFLPDPGCVLVRVDLSQAESRIIDVLTLHPWHYDRARSSPWERDVHREVASKVFNIAESAVTDDQRYLCKRAKYAGVYDITGMELSRQFAKEAIFQSPEQCQKIIDRTVEEPIRDWQQRMRGKAMRDRVVGNSWGWTFDVTGMRLNRETYKRIYAFPPQSEIGFLMHHWGFLALAEAIKGGAFKARINAHVHDELVVSCAAGAVYPVMQFIRASLERPRRYSAIGPLTIPCTWAIGRTWKGDYKWDRWPGEDEVVERVKELVE